MQRIAKNRKMFAMVRFDMGHVLVGNALRTPEPRRWGDGVDPLPWYSDLQTSTLGVIRPVLTSRSPTRAAPRQGRIQREATGIPGAPLRCGSLHSAPLPAAAGHRAVAQFGSALDWGSRGRRFKSCQPDPRNR